MINAREMRVCPSCRRVMETAETCNCQQPVIGLPRDGLRAKCPCFMHRSSYRMRNFITCRMADTSVVKTPFPSREMRNEHYASQCCGDWKQCEILNAKGASEDVR